MVVAAEEGGTVAHMVVAMEVEVDPVVDMVVALVVDGFKLRKDSALGEDSKRSDRADAGLHP